VGLALFLIGAWALFRLARDLWPTRPDLAVAVVVVPAHNLVDFSLYSSGVALPWAVLLGWAIASRRVAEGVAAAPRGQSVLVTAATVALAATVLHATSRTVENAAVAQATPQARMDAALQARQLAPWRLEPLGLAASSALESGDRRHIEMMSTEIDRARWLRPHSVALASLQSRLALALAEVPSAAADAWNAHHGQQDNEELAVYFEELLRNLDAEARSESR
jgi:hypothetical protein